MPTKEQLRKIKATNRQLAAWNDRAEALKEALSGGNLTRAQIVKRG